MHYVLKLLGGLNYMKATFISKENNIAKFSVEFTAEELTQAQNEVYKKINTDLQ